MSEQWYYAVEGVSHGPVDAGEFEALVSAGTIRRDTLVWQEGMDDWLPYGRAGGPAAATAPPLAPQGDLRDPARADANTFVGALKDGFARYVDFGTRSTRSQFWWFALWSLIFSIGASIIDEILGVGLIELVVSLAFFLPSLAVAIRRLHDIGRTGWWVLFWLVPIIGWIVLIVFYCTRSDEHANQWGEAPRR